MEDKIIILCDPIYEDMSKNSCILIKYTSVGDTFVIKSLHNIYQSAPDKSI